MRKLNIKKYRFHFALFGIWAVLILIINPSGNFPLNDDWSYAHNVRALIEEDKIYFSPWPAMTLYAQTLWATLFCKLFGFSFVVLRVATLVLAFGTSLAFFELLKRQMQSHLGAFLLTIVLIANPLFIAQSFTFMTEIYYLFFACMSLIFYSSFYKNQKLIYLVLAVLFTISTIWVRQTGLIFPLCFGLAYLFSRKLSLKNIVIAVIPSLVGIVSLVVYKSWRMSFDLPFGMGNFSEIDGLFDTLSGLDFEYFITRIGLLFHYAGFALIPVSILLLVRFKSRLRPLSWIVYALVLTPVIYTMISTWDGFPHGNVLNNFTIGPRLLKDLEFGDNVQSGLPLLLWNIIKLLNILSVLIFFHGLFAIKLIQSKSIKRIFGVVDAIKAQPFLFMMLFIAAGQFAYLIVNPIFFDRYIIPLGFSLLIISGIIIKKISRLGLVIGTSLAGLIMIIAALLERDYMLWQNSRWEALSYLTDELKINEHQIDGGFEFNAWYQMIEMAPVSSDRREKSWWWVDGDDYLITSGDFLGYHKFKAFPCLPLISQTADSVHILEKTGVVPVIYPFSVDFETFDLASNTILNSNKDALWKMIGHSNKVSKSGKYSVQLKNEEAYYYLINDLKLGERIEVSVWGKGTSGKLRITSYDEKVAFEIPSTSRNEWSKLVLDYTVVEGMVGKELVIYLSNKSDASAYFDDIRINRTPRK